jgi:hypothetical protein
MKDRFSVNSRDTFKRLLDAIALCGRGARDWIAKESGDFNDWMS